MLEWTCLLRWGLLVNQAKIRWIKVPGKTFPSVDSLAKQNTYFFFLFDSSPKAAPSWAKEANDSRVTRYQWSKLLALTSQEHSLQSLHQLCQHFNVNRSIFIDLDSFSAAPGWPSAASFFFLRWRTRAAFMIQLADNKVRCLKHKLHFVSVSFQAFICAAL